MDIHFPPYANIAYIMRDNEFIIPKGNVVLKPRDTLVIACDKADEDSLKKYLTQRASARDLQKNIASQIEKSLVKIKNTEVKEETPLPKETEETPKVVEEAPLPQEEKEATPVANKSEKKKVAPKKTTTKKTSSTNKKKTI